MNRQAVPVRVGDRRDADHWHWIYLDGIVGKAHWVAGADHAISACRRIARPADGSRTRMGPQRFTLAPAHATCCGNCLRKRRDRLAGEKATT